MSQDISRPPKSTDARQRVMLVGNPNVGKSVLFNLLTKKYVVVSNYPGTTVEVTQGSLKVDRKELPVVDTPGINNLIPMSEDELVTRNMLLEPWDQKVVQVADMKNLRRALLITLQLAEMEIPFVLDLNMRDEAHSRGIFVDRKQLSELLGVEVVETVATRKTGLDELRKSLLNCRRATYKISYEGPIEEGVQKISGLLPRTHVAKRALATMLLAGDQNLASWLEPQIGSEATLEIEEIRRKIQSAYNAPLSYVLTRRKLRAVNDILRRVQTVKGEVRQPWMAAIGRLMVHPVWGIPFLIGVLYLTYKFVGQLGAGTSVDFMEGFLFEEHINPFVTNVVNATIPVPFFRELLVGQYGLVTVALAYSFAIVLPIVGYFFLVFCLLEDTGYLPRLAVMVDKIFKVMGISGKAVLPMVLGLGCDTMATLTTRILETRKERLTVILLLALGVPCSAQLGVILGMLGALSAKATLLWLAVILGSIFGVGCLASRVLPGGRPDFIIEIPPLRVPMLSNVVVKTLARVEWYLREAVPLFILGTLVLFVLDKLNLLISLEQMTSPVIVGLLGLPQQTTEAFIVGFLRRDYGAAGLFAMAKAGNLDPTQSLVSLVTITLFLPCIANFFIMIKEAKLKATLAMVAFIFPFAFLVGGLLNAVLRVLNVSL